MALPVVDGSISMELASRNIIKYIKDTNTIERIFKIEAIRIHIHKHCAMPRQKYLEYIIKMYK